MILVFLIFVIHDERRASSIEQAMSVRYHMTQCHINPEASVLIQTCHLSRKNINISFFSHQTLVEQHGIHR